MKKIFYKIKNKLRDILLIIIFFVMIILCAAITDLFIKWLCTFLSPLIAMLILAAVLAIIFYIWSKGE